MKRPIIIYFLLSIAIVALFFIAFSTLIPHRTATVISAGRISQYTAHSGTGKNRRAHKRYGSDIRVRVKDSGETETVYYRVADPRNIPDVGDEIEFASYPLTGNGPYPQMWAVWLGVIMLGLDGIAAVLYYQWKRKRVPQDPGE